MAPSPVSNIFDKHIVIPRRPLPECLSFDGANTFKSKDSDYVCVLLDYSKKRL